MARSRSGNRLPCTSDRAVAQVIVLKKMCEGVASVQEVRRYHVQELAAALGADGDEVERSLYVLEGHKFVTPYPAGDFTSKTWQVTECGLHAVQNLPEASAGLRLVLEWV